MSATANLDSRLRGGASGQIERRQTTYWDVSLQDDDKQVVYRIHIEHKHEAFFAGRAFSGGGVYDRHPVLANYREPWLAIYLSRGTGEVDPILAALEQMIADWSEGWRRLDEYLNAAPAAAILTSGNGKLLEAPTTIAQAMAVRLRHIGLDFSTLESRRAPAECQALTLGRSFLIGDRFRVDRLP